MESLGNVLHRITQKNPAPSPSTGECWCGGMGGKVIRYIPPFGKYREPQPVFSVLCGCEAGQREATRKETLTQEMKEDRVRDALWRRWQNSGVPKRFQDFRLTTSPLAQTHPELISRLSEPVYPGDEADLEAMEAWMEADSTWWGSWYFYGPYGVGKTGLAVGFAREALPTLLATEENGPLFVTMPWLLGELRASYSRHKDSDEPTEAQVIEKYATAAVLILDDLGAEQVSGSGWMEDRLYQIIGERHDEERLTVFTSNLDLEHLSRRIGERITWRILEMCGPERVVEVKGVNLRDVKAGLG